jgi:hypothetical protein
MVQDAPGREYKGETEGYDEVLIKRNRTWPTGGYKVAEVFRGGVSRCY